MAAPRCEESVGPWLGKLTPSVAGTSGTHKMKSGLSTVAIKIASDLKSGRRSEPVATAEPMWKELPRVPSKPRRRPVPQPEPAPVLEPDATARLLLALRHYLDKGMALDEAVAAANWALRQPGRGDDFL